MIELGCNPPCCTRCTTTLVPRVSRPICRPLTLPIPGMFICMTLFDLHCLFFLFFIISNVLLRYYFAHWPWHYFRRSQRHRNTFPGPAIDRHTWMILAGEVYHFCLTIGPILLHFCGVLLCPILLPWWKWHSFDPLHCLCFNHSQTCQINCLYLNWGFPSVGFIALSLHCILEHVLFGFLCSILQSLVKQGISYYCTTFGLCPACTNIFFLSSLLLLMILPILFSTGVLSSRNESAEGLGRACCC
jgi:hypothetical protein